MTAYSTGHTVALIKAREASKLDSESERVQALNQAYLCEAFAAHYLTDLFSAGHIRAPRRAFHSSASGTMTWNGLSKIPVWDFQCRYVCA